MYVMLILRTDITLNRRQGVVPWSEDYIREFQRLHGWFQPDIP
jgi:hypothetical protein